MDNRNPSIMWSSQPHPFQSLPPASTELAVRPGIIMTPKTVFLFDADTGNSVARFGVGDPKYIPGVTCQQDCYDGSTTPSRPRRPLERAATNESQDEFTAQWPIRMDQDLLFGDLAASPERMNRLAMTLGPSHMEYTLDQLNSVKAPTSFGPGSLCICPRPSSRHTTMVLGTEDSRALSKCSDPSTPGRSGFAGTALSQGAAWNSIHAPLHQRGLSISRTFEGSSSRQVCRLVRYEVGWGSPPDLDWISYGDLVPGAETSDAALSSFTPARTIKSTSTHRQTQVKGESDLDIHGLRLAYEHGGGSIVEPEDDLDDADTTLLESKFTVKLESNTPKATCHQASSASDFTYDSYGPSDLKHEGCQ